MTEVDVPLDSITNSRLKLKLFKDVTNLKELRKKVISGELKCAVIKPSFIVDPMQVIVAANKAAITESQNSLITRTIYSEILFNLSITKNVTKSLILFGINDKQTAVLVAIIYKTDEENLCKEIYSEIDGCQCNISELSSIVDYNLVRKHYGLKDLEDNELLNAIINKIVTKEC